MDDDLLGESPFTKNTDSYEGGSLANYWYESDSKKGLSNPNFWFSVAVLVAIVLLVLIFVPGTSSSVVIGLAATALGVLVAGEFMSSAWLKFGSHRDYSPSSLINI